MLLDDAEDDDDDDWGATGKRRTWGAGRGGVAWSEKSWGIFGTETLRTKIRNIINSRVTRV